MTQTLSGHDAELVLQLQKEAQEVSGVLYPEVLQGKRRDVESFGDGFHLRLLGSPEIRLIVTDRALGDADFLAQLSLIEPAKLTVVPDFLAGSKVR